MNYSPQILTPDTTIILCKDDTLAQDAFINTLVNDYDHLQWSSGETTSSIHLTLEGKYKLTAHNECGEDVITVTAKGCPPDYRFTLFAPNLITPNNDGHNDKWEIRYKNISIERTEIMNRWGATIYRSEELHPEWLPEEEGIYYYRIVYLKPVTNETAEEKGWLQVIK